MATPAPQVPPGRRRPVLSAVRDMLHLSARPLMPAALRSALGISSPTGGWWIERFDILVLLAMQRATPLALGELDPRRGTVALTRSGPGADPPCSNWLMRLCTRACRSVPEEHHAGSPGFRRPASCSRRKSMDVAPNTSSYDFPEFLLPAGTRPSHQEYWNRASGQCPLGCSGAWLPDPVAAPLSLAIPFG